MYNVCHKCSGGTGTTSTLPTVGHECGSLRRTDTHSKQTSSSNIAAGEPPCVLAQSIFSETVRGGEPFFHVPFTTFPAPMGFAHVSVNKGECGGTFFF